MDTLKNDKVEIEEEYSIDENNFNSTLREDNELFKDEDYIPHVIISVKYLKPSGRRTGENWDILEDNKAVLRLKGNRFLKKEREFLRTPKGLQFVIAGYKEGWRSINKFKQNIGKNNDYIQRCKTGE